MPTLGLAHKLAYAMGGMAMNLTNLVISQWIFKRYVPGADDALVTAGLFGLIFAAGRVTDAVTDPLVAYWSDRLRSRWGRRIPFVALGLGPFALVFVLLWMPPVPEAHWINALFALVMVQAYFVLYTVVVTPYLALLPEITSSHAERVNLSTLQAVFVMAGTVVFVLVGPVLERWGWAGLGLVVAALSLVSFGPTVLFIREQPRPPAAPAAAGQPVGLVRWITLTFRNRPFVYLVAATSLYWFGLNLLIMLVPYWVQELLGLKEDATALVMGPFLAANAVFFVVFNRVAKRRGKYAAFLLTAAGSAVAAPALVLVGHLPFGSPLAQSGFAMALVGVPAAGFMMLPFALLADVVDHDERLTGERREAIYFGVQAIFQKSMIGLSVLVFGLVVLHGDQVASLERLRAVPLVAAAAFALGLAAFVRYPLREGGAAGAGASGEVAAEKLASGGG